MSVHFSWDYWPSSTTASIVHAADPPPCNLTRATEIPARMEAGNLLVDVQIGDRPARMKIGTRQRFSLISPQLVAQLKLRLHAVTGDRVADDAGAKISYLVNVPDVTMGTLTAADTPFLVQGENAAAPLPWDGVIGADILSRYDVEFDPAHGRINLFLPNQCKGRAAYWTQNFKTVPFTLRRSIIEFEVPLESQTVKADLDTAAADTTIDEPTAHDRFKVKPDGSGTSSDGQLATDTGIAVTFHRHRFASLEIGGVAFRNTEIGIVSDDSEVRFRHFAQDDFQAMIHNFQPAPLWIGMHHLAHLRFMIAYGEGLLYVSAADAN